MSTTATSESAKFITRPSAERGNADHGWLKTYHTFAFASYYPQSKIHHAFGPLRVINEDWVLAGEGFGTHSHREFEIFSYVLSGALEHRDSMKNLEVMKRGDVQMTSAGTGIAHSEYNHAKAGGEPVRFLQIWAVPNQRGLQPKYYNRHFSDEEKLDKLVQVVGPTTDAAVKDERDAPGPTPIHSAMQVYASLLSKDKTVQHQVREGSTKVYIHNTFTRDYRKPSQAATDKDAKLEIKAGDQTATLGEGDGLYVYVSQGTTLDITSTGVQKAEFLLFEMSD